MGHKFDWFELNYNYQLFIDRFSKMFRADCDLKTILFVIYYDEEFIPVLSFDVWIYSNWIEWVLHKQHLITPSTSQVMKCHFFYVTNTCNEIYQMPMHYWCGTPYINSNNFLALHSSDTADTIHITHANKCIYVDKCISVAQCIICAIVIKII